MIGKSERGFVSEGLEHYLARMARKEQVEQLVLPEAGKGDAAYQQRVEGERIEAAMRPGEKLVLLDEHGEEFTSTGFADQLASWRDQGVRQVAFVIGGAYGLSPGLRQRADLVMCLSRMTFPHQLVRVLFAEQLYRAYMIMEGRPYHH